MLLPYAAKFPVLSVVFVFNVSDVVSGSASQSSSANDISSMSTEQTLASDTDSSSIDTLTGPLDENHWTQTFSTHLSLSARLPSPVFALQTSVALFRHGICNIGEVSNLLKWQHNLSDIGQFYIGVFMDSNQQTWHAWILSALPLVKRKHILEQVVLKQGYSVRACAAEKNLPTQAPKQISFFMSGNNENEECFNLIANQVYELKC